MGFACYPGTFAARCLGPSATSCGIFDLLASDPGPSFQRLSAKGDGLHCNRCGLREVLPRNHRFSRAAPRFTDPFRGYLVLLSPPAYSRGNPRYRCRCLRGGGARSASRSRNSNGENSTMPLAPGCADFRERPGPAQYGILQAPVWCRGAQTRLPAHRHHFFRRRPASGGALEDFR